MTLQVDADDRRLVACTSRSPDPARAVAELAAEVGDRALAGALLFCSNSYSRDALARELAVQLPNVPLFGCTSAGELADRGYDTNSIVLIGFPAEIFSIESLRFDDLDHFDAQAAQGAIRQLVATERHGRSSDESLHQVALFFVDGLSHREELLTMTAQHALGDIQLIGGSGGDGLSFKDTAVLHDGAFHADAAVIVLLTSRRPLHVFCTNFYRPGPSKMVITEADPESRVVHEINAAPAAEEYLRLSGSPASVLDAHFFAAHPPIVRTGGQFHMRSIQSANDDGSLTFYCAIDTGVVLSLGEPVDRIAAMEELFAEIERKVGTIDHVIGFDCVLNRLDAEDRQQARAVSQMYVANRVFGFNTYGEQFRAAHMNQTFTGLAVGR
ncbi:FIST N-terminal domain-containing protein [Novosphingobium sp. MMS21-SN21R]|uniref:FIST N-terminal domain-containing protein n=1 Tax=Novosphingobium sp. MMS21-SN21R TaxID=2969298 RepID=UPI002887DFED|nr:FIST N-terminal domain-containing protein [Novosphingobium sp. MMS21-SN21R]MDT0510028.1 FIST N-terminal domain-containing protein [Novosphingobium sp. MMS21-SN21R]